MQYKPKYKKIYLALSFGLTDVASILREAGRTEVVDDISAVSIEVVKMTVEIPEPIKYPGEPDFAALLVISAKTKKLLEAKKEILEKAIDSLNKEGKNIKYLSTGSPSIGSNGVKLAYRFPFDRTLLSFVLI